MACIHDDRDDDLEDRDDPLPEDQDDDLDDGLEVMPCPCCGRPTVEDAHVCPHCGGFIAPDTPARTYPWWIYAAALAALAAMLLWIF